MMRGLVLLSAVCFAAASVALADIYRWKDDAGVLHVTNDPTKVPAGKLESAKIRSLRDVNVTTGGATSAGGRGVFEQKCGSCHLAGMDSTGDGEGGDGKLAILPFLIDPESKLPMDKKAALERLSFAAEGRFSDMPAIDVAPEELDKIADYLLGKLR